MHHWYDGHYTTINVYGVYGVGPWFKSEKWRFTHIYT